MHLAIATPADIPDIMAIERTEGFDQLVGRAEAASHAASMADESVRYWIARDETGKALGFAVLAGLNDKWGNILLRRIAVGAPGNGTGTKLLAEVIDRTFIDIPTAYRFWLDVFEHNARARRAYTKLGFTEEGVIRQGYILPDGKRVDRIMMSVLRPEWRRPA
ncbi:MAG TPA: GNAT family protein [Hyphomonadaceae bacterium]|nr:GNAT family protein [Hyphomonadaceae bacterium]